jgi:predicted aspartyl protease
MNQNNISFSLTGSSLKEIDSNEHGSSTNDLPDKDFGIISCRKLNDHLVVPANIDIHGKDVKIDLLLDTGASMTTIPLKYYLAGNPKELATLEKKDFLTANGKVSFPIDVLSVNTTAFSKSIEVAMSEDNNLGLLGSNYFKGTVFTVDVDNECIYVHASESKPK